MGGDVFRVGNGRYFFGGDVCVHELNIRRVVNVPCRVGWGCKCKFFYSARLWR